MRYSVLSLNLIAKRYKKKKDSFLPRHGDGPHNQVPVGFPRVKAQLFAQKTTD